MNETAKTRLLAELGQLAQAHPDGDEDYLHRLWKDWNRAQVYRQAEIPVDEENLDPSALEALAANRQLVQLLEGRRWYVVAEARAQGARWQQIADALGVTRQSAPKASRCRCGPRGPPLLNQLVSLSRYRRYVAAALPKLPCHLLKDCALPRRRREDNQYAVLWKAIRNALPL